MALSPAEAKWWAALGEAALKLRLADLAALVAVFAVLHGHAHGAEMPATADPITYGAVFILAPVLLHLIGIGLGLALKAPRIVRAGGAAIAVAGVALVSVL